ncbi:MAG: bifunctional phosphopantothenoylcysteine decarboxylase/phosphopantothenate--cysteine ligase CoaBC [Bdellovibrionales bacterium]|nr:bifunctional phosphopantothenoylcysteine decarboxylase/phosphopantothenate--cysteine ligase CoaBC [Bdellovibrionales bacterium]
MSTSKKILFAVSGSIAAFKAVEVVSKLVQSGYQVQVVMTNNAQSFIGPASFEGITGRPVGGDVFEPGKAMSHIDLTRWADLFVICPCSAELISKLAHGSASDLPSTLFLAQPKSLRCLIFPAMNQEMWSHELLQRNVKTLNELDNVNVVDPASGSLACGETGKGRLLEPREIIDHIHQALKGENSKILPKPRILVTGGGTIEAIDSVRSLTNFSSGQTAGLLAEHLKNSDFEVELLLSESARHEPHGVPAERFNSHQNLSERLRAKLAASRYDGVIHLAAVSDFRVSLVNGMDSQSLPKKISSESERMTIELERTPKIIDQLREWSQNKASKIIGFKLTSSSTREERLQKSKQLLRRAHLDGVVSNDLSEISEESHCGFLLSPSLKEHAFQTKTQLFSLIEEQLRGTL